MIKNSLMKFIDSCVGNIARKIEDEFRESDHPRDKGGKFTSKGGEGRGAGGLHHAGKDVEKYGKDLEAKHKETVEKQKARRGASELEETDFEKEAKKELGSGKESGSEETSVKTPNAQAVEELIDTAAEGFDQNLDVVPEFVKQMGYKYSRGEKSYYEQYPRELIDVALDLIEKDPYKAHEVLGPWVDHIDLDEEDDDSVTGPEGQNYMNEEDDRDEETVRRNLNAQLSLYNNHPDWLTEEDMSSIKKDMHKLGMDEEVELMSDKKALKNFQKQAQAAADNLDDNEIEELLESAGVASHRIRQGDVYKMVKQHIKDDPIRLHAAMRKQGLLKFLK